MRSTFYGLDIATKGLFVSQRQLDITGHNISNANTDGYSRQRFISSAIPMPGINGQFAQVTKGQVGQGVETLSLDQIRDRFLDRQYRQEVSKGSYWDTKASALYYVEDVFNGTYETRLDGIVNSFFNAVQETTKNPTDQAVRTNLTQEAKKLTDVMHSYNQQLVDLMYQQDYALAQQVNVINEYSQQIAALNENILKFEQGGQVANDLRDHRNVLLDKLAELADIAYEEVGTGMYGITGLELTTMNVYIGVDKESLVEHTDWRKLVASQEYENDAVEQMDGGGGQAEPKQLHLIRFDPDEDNGEILELSSGELKGLLDIRDGNTKDNQGIPYFLAQLDELAAALVETFNAIHMTGFTMPYTDENGEYHSSVDGVPFFDEASRTAATIRLSDQLLASCFNFAASSEPVEKLPDENSDDVEAHYNTGNNEIALQLIKGVKERNDIEVVGSIEGFFKSFISELAAEVGHANQMYEAEAVLTDSIQSQRLSVMGVSVDEEMTNMIRFQHAYNAAARAITAMDEMLDVLINRTGRVGL